MLLQLVDFGPLSPIFLVDVDLMVVGAQCDLWSTETVKFMKDVPQEVFFFFPTAEEQSAK